MRISRPFRQHRLFPALLVFFLFQALALADERSFELNLGGLHFDPLTAFPQLESGGHHLRDSGENFRLIQFEGSIRNEWLQSVRTQGMEIVQYIHPYTYVVWADQSQLSAARNVTGVRWAGEFAAEFRVVPEQRGFTAPDEATMISVSRFADKNTVRTELTAAGFKVLRITPFTSRFNLVMATGPGEAYMDLARMPSVYTVQRAPVAVPRGEMSNQSIVGNYGSEPDNVIFPGYVDWLNDTGYDGSGVTVSIVDGGVRTTHQDLSDRIVPCESQGTPTSCTSANNDHGTHVAGAVAGTGATGIVNGDDFLRGQGVAPGANLVQQRYSSSGLNYPWGAQCNDPQPPDGGYCISPDGMLILFKEAALSGATHANNSWGSLGIKIGYDLPTQQLDVMVRDANSDTQEHEPVLPVWSIQNGGGDSSGNCGQSSLGSPDEAKNAFAVGSTRLQTAAGAQQSAIFGISANSAHGPACDGRVGVHIVAPGSYTDSTSSSGDTSYTLKSGTSMASPVVSGSVAVFIERFRDLYGTTPSPALIKAAFTAVATNMHGRLNADGGSITETPSRFQGWGRLDLEAAVNPPNNVLYFDQEEVFTATGQDWLISLVADDPAEPVRLMLIWTDAHGPGLAGDTPSWVNILNLNVDADTGTYLGNQIGTDGFSETGGDADEMNNMEGVFLRPDQHNGNSFEVTVLAANLAADALNPHDPDSANPTQDFALVCYNCTEGGPGFTLEAEPESASACVPQTGAEDVFVDVTVGADDDYAGTVNLSASGEPAGVIGEFDPDTVTAPGVSVWTLTIDETATVGDHTITLTGDDGTEIQDLDFTLMLNELLSAPILLAPADGTGDVVAAPEFVWDAIAGATGYRLQVAGDASFTDLAIDQALSETAFTPNDELDGGSEYYWRVRADNECGEGGWSDAFTFTTAFPPIPAVLALEPEALDFGTIMIDTTRTLTLDVSNVAGEGGDELPVSAINLVGMAVFEDTGNGSCEAGATELAAGESCSMEVAFTPSSTGNFVATLIVESGDDQKAQVELSGAGTDQPPSDEVFNDRFED